MPRGSWDQGKERTPFPVPIPYPYGVLFLLWNRVRCPAAQEQGALRTGTCAQGEERETPLPVTPGSPPGQASGMKALGLPLSRAPQGKEQQLPRSPSGPQQSPRSPSGPQQSEVWSQAPPPCAQRSPLSTSLSSTFPAKILPINQLFLNLFKSHPTPTSPSLKAGPDKCRCGP